MSINGMFCRLKCFSMNDKNKVSRELAVVVVCLVSVLFLFFFKSFSADWIVFSNDGPLGANKSAAAQLPDAIFGQWWDLNWVGSAQPNAPASLTTALRWFLGPVFFAKFYSFACLFVLGMSAWLFFRVMRFHSIVCVIGALAAALNGNVFSNMAWGQGSRPLSLAAAFLALAAIHSARFGNHWIKIILAGLAVGWGVSEGFDIGALFSICIALFAIFYSFITEEGIAAKVSKGLGRAALIAICAALLAAQTVAALLATQLKGSPATAPGGTETMNADSQWAFITDLSTPKLEVLGVMVPGIFGYATTSPEDKVYWGQQSRWNGSGEYAGVLVVIMALAAIAFSFRRDSNLTRDVRRLIWFWSGLGLICLLFAFGKNAPFYKLIYPLPFFSSMRNPMKFMHLFHLCLLVLFGIGLQAIYDLYLKSGTRKASALKLHLSKWWSLAPKFDRKFAAILVVSIGVGLLGWLIYSSSKIDIIKAIQATGVDETRAALVAKFSISTVAWFALITTLSASVLILIFSGWFSGKNARFALMLLGLILTADLVKANKPWFVFWNYKNKYATNPVIDFLRQKPYEKRVDIIPFSIPEMQLLSQVFGIEWAQHHFFYYDIQASHIVQDPRPQADDAAMRQALSQADTQLQQIELLFRKWELMSTRYLLGTASLVDALNQQFAKAAKGRFKSEMAFDLVPKPDLKQGQPMGLQDLTAVLNPNGKLALVEFTGALPKAKLYASWQTITDPKEVLKKLTSPEFDPHASVIVQEDVGAAAASNSTNAGTVEFVNYTPKHIELLANVETKALLLLNDKYHPDWKVSVDGKPAKLLRGNYIMRVVALEPGEHSIVYKFEPPITTLYVTVAAIGVGLLLCGFLFVSSRRVAAVDAAKEAGTAPVNK